VTVLKKGVHQERPKIVATQVGIRQITKTNYVYAESQVRMKLIGALKKNLIVITSATMTMTVASYRLLVVLLKTLPVSGYMATMEVEIHTLTHPVLVVVNCAKKISIVMCQEERIKSVTIDFVKIIFQVHNKMTYVNAMGMAMGY
tara:strand:+ start:137 stop:571 length:435 start_codon:yes stop_codon:yes gene_type:complete